MSKPVKENENIYRKARIRASDFNEKFKSREGASESIGVSKDSLTNYELGLCKQVPVDVVVKMADAYNSPELMNNYCTHECPIGKLTISPVNQDNINNIYKLSIGIFNLLGEGGQMGKKLLDIVEDGQITEDEKPTVDYIVDNLKRLSGFTNELLIAIEKSTIEGGE
ncbi:transcriptional regulator [Clostridium chromiireducens]|uniref:Transcriptional regulator n=1 Tax=Clostridium chromiireducens TaxID=225345 RepID=A0A964RIT4_9CLOT|nr:helix-turn-helix transcriptional regulator [Clostridium chromiireducens]MVX62267.1 transcriptional regulator [Clostridium chromiireducens]